MEKSGNSYQIIFEKLQLNSETNVQPLERLNQIPILSTPLISQQTTKRRLNLVSSTSLSNQKIPKFTVSKINPLFARQSSIGQTFSTDSVDEQFMQISKTLKEINQYSVETKMIGKCRFAKSQTKINTQDDSIFIPQEHKTKFQPRNLRDLQIRMRTYQSAQLSSLNNQKGSTMTPPIKQRSRKSSVQYLNIFETISSSTSIRIPHSPKKVSPEENPQKKKPNIYYRKSIFQVKQK